MKENACLILDPEDHIINISSSVLRIFPSLKKLNSKSKIKITEIIPNFSDIKKKVIENN